MTVITQVFGPVTMEQVLAVAGGGGSVDSTARASAAAAQSTANAALPKAGGTMTGQIVLPGGGTGLQADSVQERDAAITAAQIGTMSYRGLWDASGGTFPITGGRGPAGVPAAADFWIISVAGTLGGTIVSPGDTLVSKIDSPGQTGSNWDVGETNIGYVPENVANKSQDMVADSGSATKYPSVVAVENAIAAATLPAYVTELSSNLVGTVGPGPQTLTYDFSAFTPVPTLAQIEVMGDGEELTIANGFLTAKTLISGVLSVTTATGVNPTANVWWKLGFGTGNTGPAGAGVPNGGTTGQVLAKASNSDQDTEWVDQTGGGSANWLPNGEVNLSLQSDTMVVGANNILQPPDIGANAIYSPDSFNLGDFICVTLNVNMQTGFTASYPSVFSLTKAGESAILYNTGADWRVISLHTIPDVVASPMFPNGVVANLDPLVPLVANANNRLLVPDTGVDTSYNMPLGVDGDTLSVTLTSDMDPGFKVDTGVGTFANPYLYKAGDSALYLWSDALAGWTTVNLIQRP